jgi:hypothetical protein
MGRSFAEIAFTPHVKEEQAKHGSRSQYERMEKWGEPGDALTQYERDFIGERDFFYLATISETDWPYIQHRGGKPGFLHVIDDKTLAFADYRGNRQYISLGNLDQNDRVAIFLVDYPSRSRLKILGHAAAYEGERAQKLIEEVSTPQERKLVERVIVIKIEAFDWNCQQHITPRYTEEQVVSVLAPLRERLADLEEENKRLKSELASGPSIR